MSNSKISALTASTTPLAGTEVLPIVQSSTTKQVSVANLTAGRAVSALSLTSTNDATVNGATIGRGAGNVATNTVLGNTAFASNSSGVANVAIGYYSQNGTTGSRNVAIGRNSGQNLTGDKNTCIGDLSGSGITSGSSNTVIGGYSGAASPVSGSGTNYVVFSDGDGNVRGYYDNSGNLVVPVAAKGVNFTANTPATGMTSQLLNWYEEGVYTPTAGGFVVVLGGGTVTYAGKYTRVGRLVKVTITITTTGAATVAAAGGATCYLSLPFAPSTIDSGTWANTSTFATSGVVTVNTNQNMFVVNSWTAANSSWTLQASYNV